MVDSEKKTVKKPTISPRAERDLDDIWSYVAEDSVEYADRVIDDLNNRMKDLVAMPRIGRRRADLMADESLAFWPASHYMIVYRPDSEPIEIVRVLHTSRDIPVLLEES